VRHCQAFSLSGDMESRDSSGKSGPRSIIYDQSISLIGLGLSTGLTIGPVHIHAGFFIVGGFYSEVALQKREAEGTVRAAYRYWLPTTVFVRFHF